jgi:uncharacterized protein (DUF983 family)
MPDSKLASVADIQVQVRFPCPKCTGIGAVHDRFQKRVVTCSVCRGEKVVTEWVPITELPKLLEVRP